MAIVTVPKAAMNENHGLKPRENQIGLAWKVSAMQSVAKAHFVERPADHHLRLGILTPDTSHYPAPGFCVHNISQMRLTSALRE